MIVIRRFKPGDVQTLRQLFYNTIRTVNRKDYTQLQTEAWAPDEYDIDTWKNKLVAISPYVAEIDGVTVGYADVQESGLIDHFFCDSRYQGKGVGRELMQALFNKARKLELEELHSHVSITAKPFFQHFGFEVITSQQVEIRGQILTNFLMKKQIF